MNLSEETEVIDKMCSIYGGGRAARLREEGDATAMPPWAETYWLGKQVVKCPMDLWVYQEIIFETKPELIIETGTSGAGSAWFFAHILDQIGRGQIVTVDKDSYPHLCLPHPRINYLVGDSIGAKIAREITSMAASRRTMVSLDSLHTYDHVARELALYGPLVTRGCYLVVEDTGTGGTGQRDWCSAAAADFVAANPDFVVDKTREKHLLTSNRGGWLRRI